MAKNLILVVDDDKGVLGFIPRAIERYGFGTVTSECSVDAIKLYNKLYNANKDNLFAVITDIEFPENKGDKPDKKNGLGLISKIKEDNSALCVIGTSGGLKEKEAKNAGADFYFEKPYKIADIMAAIKTK